MFSFGEVELVLLTAVLTTVLFYLVSKLPAFRARMARYSSAEERREARRLDGKDLQPPTFAERALLGGPAFFSAGLFYIVVISSLAFGQLVYGGPWTWVILASVICFLHLVIAFAWPRIEAKRGRHQKVVEISGYNLSAPFMNRRGRASIRILQVQSLLALGRGELARKLLPEVLEDSSGPSAQRSLGDQVQRLVLAADFVEAGLDDVAEELLDVPGWTRFEGPRTAQMSYVLWSQGRVAEAQALITSLEKDNQPAKQRAAILNNLAVYGIDLGEDPQSVLDKAREAVALAPRQVIFQRTLGAATLYADGDPGEALRLLEEDEKAMPKVPGPQARAWLDLHRGLAYECLGRSDEARDSLGRAAAIGGPAGESAADRLQCLAERQSTQASG